MAIIRLSPTRPHGNFRQGLNTLNYRGDRASTPTKQKTRTLVFVACALIVISGVAEMFRPLPSIVQALAVIALVATVVCLVYAANFLRAR